MRIRIHNTGTDTDDLPNKFNDRLGFIRGQFAGPQIEQSKLKGTDILFFALEFI